ncbi:hypothetical protein VTJ49DRAFT_5923 [Mycothermus thermophilus]|uniref:Secreted protein n=1 Tax=Humicola insolens TaxID=85995 RepID=A0ABR3VK46_HUMIN
MVKINPRTIMAPAAAFTMACILFTDAGWGDRYTRSSIRAARVNAQAQKDAQKQQSRYSSSQGESKE